MTRTSWTTLAATLFAAALAAGCKGETKTVDNPQTLEDLKKCEESKKQKDELITSLTNEKAQWMREKGQTGGEIVVTIEGNALTVKGTVGGSGGVGVPPIDPKLASAASKQFIDLVAKSRGAIQKCYEAALKKDTSIQARTITLRVDAAFTDQGAYRDASFAPSLGATFDSCMKGIAQKWALTEKSPAMRFKAQVSLTPS
jgi:hypothetical protein